MPDTNQATQSLLSESLVYKPFRYPWAFEAWETQQQVHWLPKEVPLASDVDDWHNNLSAAEQNLLTQIFRFFTQADVEVNNCYRAGTEILTTAGWKDFRSLTDDDAVAQVGTDGRADFVRPSRIVRQAAPPQMIRFYTERGVDLTVTPDHDMVVSAEDGLRKVPAQSYPKVQHILQPLAASLRDEGEGLSPRDRLLIAYQADAKASRFQGERKNDCQIVFRLKKDRKINRLLSILSDGGFDFVERDASGVTQITCTLPEAAGYVGKDFGWVDLGKVNAAWCREFIREVSQWDGWISESGNIQYRSTHEGAVDKVQAVATLAGYKTRKTFLDREYQSDHWMLSITSTRATTMTRRVEREIVTPDPGEEVFCVTVPSGMVLVRNAGMPVVSGNCYMKHYSQVFKPTEVLMMLSAFSNIETIHVAAYSHLLDTIGMPEIEYSAFLKYKEMKDKFDYMQSFRVDSKHEIAKTMAAFGAFTEGLQLFASFAILLNFPRHNKMKGMGQIIAWSVRDETLHCLSVIRLFHTFVQENPEIWTARLKGEITLICATIVEHEDAFIDLAFEQGPVEGMTAEGIKQYIRYIADRRLEQLGMAKLYAVDQNPLPWLDDMLNAVEHANFFENRSTEYSRASTQGTWEEALSSKTFSQDDEYWRANTLRMAAAD